MSISVFVNFNGNCKEAVEFYAKVFDCDMPKYMTYADIPISHEFIGFPDDQKELIMYTELTIADAVIMFSDTTPEMSFVAGNNVNITIGHTDMEKIKTWFARLSDGAVIQMEPQKTFWSDCYGMLVDKFGIPWQLSHESGKSN